MFSNIKAFLMNPITELAVILCLIVVGFYLGRKYKYQQFSKQLDRIFFILGIVYIACETCKMIVTIVLGRNIILVLPANWSSLPIYTFVLYPFIKRPLAKSVLQMFTGGFCFLIGLLFFSSSAYLTSLEIPFYFFQSYFWHMSMIFVGSFCVLSCKAYGRAKIKPFLICLAIVPSLLIFGAVMNYIFRDCGLNFFMCGLSQSVYPVVSLIIKSTEPYYLYILVYLLFSILFSTLGFVLLSILMPLIDKKPPKNFNNPQIN